ncbi:MAG TPA: pantoate--beta-alanine ligase [Bosea sp. (in: a-proteobacteria)]|jgi:pantoate--beta-alanine ligase|uniref:pantoate--beta-alanine ligase n=1 Tax=Bosea sp. (in: a-proteobacteria) TaxID=1871050 RepID=UPI002DDD71FE|nr:pantoate--beta-alanine ligase [Bosea sp. (in: a-proteobacteria)]HEV2552162.1 pantoate--beta-alanine ligase [Bosea sp. (in: a-proteobacteria)]
MTGIAIFETVSAMRQAVAGWHAAGETVGLVPTMGALHEGHIALVQEAQRRAKRVIVTIFVNPTQFAPHEDFKKYPRTFDDDCAKLVAAGADAVFFPAVEEMYPAGFATRVLLLGPAAVGLDDRFRPTHFEGVATICCKLFTQSRADLAVFGEKDYQQLKVVTRMAADLDLGIEIVPLPTFREGDGLAMSSRNRYLSPQDRALAPLLHAVMQALAVRIRNREDLFRAVGEAQGEIISAGFELDYLEARHADTLAPVTSLADGPIRILVAARLGATRLIDNIPV